jgi:hypothetical protein
VLSFEALLVLGVLLFYLYDSLMLLNINELVFQKSFKRWSYRFPVFGFQILRKFPLMMNLLMPNNLAFNLSWPSPKEEIDSGRLEILIKSLLPLQIIAFLLMILIIFVLPFVALVFDSGPELLTLFMLIYLLIFLSVCYLFIYRDSLMLSGLNFLSIAFECILCPPFAINIARKVSMSYEIGSDPIDCSKMLFDKQTFKLFKSDLTSLLKTNMKYYKKDSARYTELQSYLNDITKTK